MSKNILKAPSLEALKLSWIVEVSKTFTKNVEKYLKERYLESLKLPRIVESLTALLHVLIIILVLFLILMRIVVLLILIVVLMIIVKASEEGGPAALAEGPVALGYELLLLLLLNISAVTAVSAVQ
jgi:hypothetical protein